MSSPLPSSDVVLAFWFEETSPKQWWTRSNEFDALITARFSALYQAAARCELFAWRDTPQGRLAEIIVLDQFSRNMFREQARAFACDPLALALAQTAITVKADRELETRHRAFLYMPFMHSESAAIHASAVSLWREPGLEDNLKSALRHKEIIDRFGRFPHRNAVLGRESTPEETEFLKTPGSSF